MKVVPNLDSKFTRFYCEVVDWSFEIPQTVRYYSPEPGKTLKKLHKHLVNKYLDNKVDVFAFVESEEEGELQDMSMYWMYEQMEHESEWW